MAGSRSLSAFAIAVALWLHAASALALEPPASEAQMTEAAQAIARVEVERVVCLGPTKQEGDWEVTRYRATMRRIETIKGSVPERFELAFAEVDAGDDIQHSIVFQPGWRGRVFLAGTAPSFSLVEWNGAISDPTRSRGELPSCGGGCAGCATHPRQDDSRARALALALALVIASRGRRLTCLPRRRIGSSRRSASRSG
jgi:hypothetical protein